MALTSARLVSGQSAYAADVKQFYDLLTGVMTDQAVTLANVLNLTKASGVGLAVTNEVTIGGLTTVGNGLHADGSIISLVDGPTSGGFLAGASSDVQWYRDTGAQWRSPTAVQVDGEIVTLTSVKAKADGSSSGFLAGAATDVQWYRASDAAHWETGQPVRAKEGVLVTADKPTAGLAGFVSYTGAVDSTVRSTGVGTIKFKDGTDRDCVAFLKVFGGTTAYYIPLFAAS